MDGTGILFAVIFGGLLAHSIATGTLQLKAVSVERDGQPVLFWFGVLTYMGFIGLSLLLAFSPKE
jgi:hypothetical protein